MSHAAQGGTAVVNNPQNADAITEISPASDTEVLLKKVLDRSQFWAGCRSETLKSLSYDYELNGRRQSIKLVSEISNVPRSQWEGATLNSGMHSLAANASAFTVHMEEIKTDPNKGEDIVRLTCRRKDPAQSLSVAFGNGVDGRWSGYFSHGAKEIVLDVDRRKMLPIHEQLDGTSVTYSDWKVVDENHSVPGLVRVQRQEMLWEMNFDWVGNAAWLLTYTESGVGANKSVIARTLNVQVNDQDVVRELTDKERRRQESTAPVRTMVEHNRLWLQPELSAADSLSYTFHSLREDIKESCYVNRDGIAAFEILHDGQVKPAGREKEDNTGRRSIALSNGQWATGDRSQEYLYIHEPNRRERTEPHGKRLRRYGLIGCQLDLPLFRINEVLDNLRATTTTGQWNGTDCDVVLLNGAGRNAWLGAGTMLVFSSSSYVHDIYPASTTLYVDNVRHVPLHESIRGGRDHDFEIDYSDWKEAEPGQWVPLSIKVESKDYFTCEYQFQLIAGKHWMLQELTSWFDPGNKSRAVVSDVQIDKPSDFWNHVKTQLDKTERLFSSPKAEGDEASAASVTLKTTPLEFGRWVVVDDVRVMLTVASLKALVLKLETDQKQEITRLPIVLFDSKGRAVECDTVALQEVDGKWSGTMPLSIMDANELSETAIGGKGGNTARVLPVEPINIGASQPINVPDNTRGKTRAAELKVSSSENGDTIALVKVVSVIGQYEFPVFVDVVLFDENGQPVTSGQNREVFRVDGKPDIHSFAVNLGLIPPKVRLAHASVIVRNGPIRSSSIGYVWARGGGITEVKVPIEKLFAAEDLACGSIAVEKLNLQINGLRLHGEYFGRSRDREQLAKSKQSALDIVKPYAAQLESLLLDQSDEALNRNIARLLGFTGDVDRGNAVLPLLDAPDEDTRDVAAIVLAILGSDTGFNRLKSILERPAPDYETSRDAWRKHDQTEKEVLIALMSLNSNAAVDLLGATLVSDLQASKLLTTEDGKTNLNGMAYRAKKILQLAPNLNAQIAPWLGKAADYFDRNSVNLESFDQSILATALLEHEESGKTIIEAKIRQLNMPYIYVIKESRNPYYLSAVQELLLNDNANSYMYQAGVKYLWNLNTPESIAFLKRLYGRKVPEDLAARMQLCAALVHFNDDRGLVEALSVMSDSFIEPPTSVDGVVLKKNVKLQEQKRKQADSVVRRASSDMILKVVDEKLGTDEVRTRRAILVFLRSTGTLPQAIEQTLGQWATDDDPSLKAEASEFLETRGILLVD